MPISSLPPIPTDSPQIFPPGLYDKLTQNNGSNLSYHDGATPDINPLSTRNSNLHYDVKSNKGGYSTLGPDMDNYQQFVSNFSAYQNGANPYLPLPSQLELTDPIGADPNYKPIYTPTNSYKSKISFLNQL